MDCDRHLDEAATRKTFASGGDVWVVAEGVKAWHKLIEHRQELLKRRFAGGKCVQELLKGDVRAFAQIAIGSLSLL